MMTAPKLNFLIDVFDIRACNPECYDILVKEKIGILYEHLDRIKALSDDEYKVLYFSVPKGSVEEYSNCDELNFDRASLNYQELVDEFNRDYPNELYWYKIISTRYKNYRMISINSKNIIYADMDGDSCFENCQLQELLDFLIGKVKECIKDLEEGTYNDYIKENYSYKNRFGVIKRKDYWNLYPDIKKNLLNEISQDEIVYFIKNASDKQNNRIKNMTSGKYFDYVGLIYKKLGYEIGDLTNKQLYLKYADARDEGLSELDENSSVKFDKWYSDNSRFGGHPWEIIRGHSFSRVNLVVCHDELGYYLLLDGSKILRKTEIAQIFNVLNENCIPVQIYDVDLIKDAFNGEDYIGIVPDNILPIACGGYFKKYNPLEFVHIEDENMLKYIKWETLETIELK